MKYISILFFLIISLNCFSLTIGERRKAILSVINMELKELTRLNKQGRSRNPKLILRIAELYLEKARHVKEVENIKYLQLSTKERKKTSKNKYFSKSNQYLKQAQKSCLYILNRFKSFRKKSDVYYILAYNAKEFGDSKSAEKYFRQSVKYSKNDSRISNKSRLALADIYYNKRDYPSAIRLYKQAMKYKKHKNKWYTKDAYNLAWSYFRVGKKSKAISLMKEVHKLSQDDYYVDMSSNVERDLSYFYTDAGKTDSAIKFFKKTGKDISSHLIKVAKHLKSQGKYTTAEKSFIEALKYAKNEKDIITIHIELLSVYEKFFSTEKHLASCKTLFSYFTQSKLNADQFDVFKYHLQRMSASLQKKVVGKHFKRRKVKRLKLANQTVEYFKMLAIVDSKKSHLAYFYSAVTMYTVEKYNEAVELYDKSFDLSKSRGDRKIQKRSFDGEMSSLGQKGISKKVNDKYLVPAYLYYLKTNPSSRKSDTIYQRLFSNHYSKKHIKKAEKVLFSYRKHFRRNYKTQEAMLAKIMDYYKDKNDFKKIRAWSKRIDDGQFVVSKKYAKVVKSLLLSMQFQDVDQARTKGDQLGALKIMVSIYRDPGSRPEAKKNAAYNIMLLFHKLGNIKLTYEWAKKALKEASPKDVLKFQESYIAISTEFLNQRHFNEAFIVNFLTLKKLCKTSSKNKNIFFKNAAVTALADDQAKSLKDLLSIGRKCRISRKRIRETNFDLMYYFKENRYWSKYQKQINLLEKNKENWPILIAELSVLKNEVLVNGSVREKRSLTKKIYKYYNYSLKKRMSIPLDSLNVIALLKEVDVNNIERKLKSLKLKFPEKTFNNILKQKISIIGKLTEASLDLLKTRSGIGIVKGYRYLVDNYSQLAKEVSEFVPTGKSKEYKATFKKAMNNTVKPLFKRARMFKLEAREKIIENDILTEDNIFFIQGKRLPFEVKFIPPRDGVLMDRGGQR